MSSSYLINLRDSYITFDNQVQEIVTSLSYCNNSTTDAKNILENNYKIDNILPDNNKLADSLTNINDTISFLNSTIRVAISNKIANLNQQIEYALQRECEERNAIS